MNNRIVLQMGMKTTSVINVEMQTESRLLVDFK